MEIQAEHFRAFEDERARGTFGAAPGSIWEIGADGRAKLRVPNAREQVLKHPPVEQAEALTMAFVRRRMYPEEKRKWKAAARYQREARSRSVNNVDARRRVDTTPQQGRRPKSL